MRVGSANGARMGMKPITGLGMWASRVDTQGEGALSRCARVRRYQVDGSIKLVVRVVIRCM